jgi:IS605 OrfB family transposase
VVLARHAGAARFAFNQCLRLHLQARTQPDREVVPWTGFDFINAFNAWKKTSDAGRVFTVDSGGVAEVQATGLAWRREVCQQVFEEAAVDLSKALKAWTDSRRGKREGMRVGHPRPGMARQRRLGRAVTRKQRGSRKRRKAAARLGRHHAHVRNIRQHFLHQVSNELVKTHDRLVIEDLNVTGMLANHGLAQAISDAGWTEFARLLAYKQEWRSGDLVTADRWFASTKTCSACGTTKQSMTLADRVFECEHCGLIIDRDLNAAINLATWAEQNYAQVRDPQAGGPVTNAHRREGTGPHPRAGETGLDDVGTDVQTAPAA